MKYNTEVQTWTHFNKLVMGLVLSMDCGIVVVFVVVVVVKAKTKWKFWLLTFSARLDHCDPLQYLCAVCIADFVIPSFPFHKTIIILNGWQMVDMQQSVHHHWVQWKYTIPSTNRLTFDFLFFFPFQNKKEKKNHPEIAYRTKIELYLSFVDKRKK